MPVPSTIDVTAPFDTTAYSSITGAQLLQLVSGVVPYTDKGMIIVTTDVGVNPVVPDASVTTKWQRYIWMRFSASAVSVYVWNSTIATQITYLNWQSITISGIGVGSIVGSMIADNTIADIKIISLDASKLTGSLPVGTTAIPSGAAGGALAGTYPNPVLNVNAVDTTNILGSSVTNAKVQSVDTSTPTTVSNTGISPLTKIRPNSVGLTQLRTNVAANALEYFVPQAVVNLVNPVAGDASKQVRVNVAETGFELAKNGSVQKVAKALAAGVDCAGTVADVDTIPTTSDGTVVITSATFTPVGATNLVRVQFSAWVSCSNAGAAIALFLVKSGSANAVHTVSCTPTNNGERELLTIDYVATTGAAGTYAIYAGASAGTTYVGKASGGSKYGSQNKAYLVIEEFQGTLT